MRESSLLVAGQEVLTADNVGLKLSVSRGVPLRTGRLRVRILHAAPISPMESKPQQTGTRLLTGHGEVATTSGSTHSIVKCGIQNAVCTAKHAKHAKQKILFTSFAPFAGKILAGWSSQQLVAF